MSRTQESRESDPRAAQAAREVGRTQVGRSVSWLLVLSFALTLLAGSVPELGRGRFGAWGVDGPLANLGRSLAGLGRAGGLLAANRILEQALNEAEEGLESAAWPVETIVPPVQDVLSRSLGWASERVVPGRDGWLFYRPAVELLTGPGFLEERWLRRGGRHRDPVPALTSLARDLDARGIELLVVPVPVKAALHPERLCRREAGGLDLPLTNASWPDFLERMEEAGVAVVDPGPWLASLRAATEEPLFLEADSHWRPQAVRETARVLARWIDERVGPLPGREAPHRAREVPLRGRGDLSRMLGQDRWRLGEEVEILQVLGPDGELWRPRRGAPVLVLGDSFTNVYSHEDLGWGEGAGLGAQLSLQLSREVDVVAVNDGGALGSRRELARDPGLDSRLEDTRIVVWVFSSRELLHGDWAPLSLPPPGDARAPVDDREAGAGIVGRVAAVAPLPAPGSTPYRDVLRALLVEVQEGAAEAERVVVYTWAIQDGETGPGAALAVGDEVEMSVVPWGQVEEDYGSLQRQELDDPELLWLPAFWSESVRRP